MKIFHFKVKYIDNVCHYLKSFFFSPSGNLRYFFLASSSDWYPNMASETTSYFCSLHTWNSEYQFIKCNLMSPLSHITCWWLLESVFLASYMKVLKRNWFKLWSVKNWTVFLWKDKFLFRKLVICNVSLRNIFQPR